MLMGTWLARGYLLRARWGWWVREGWRAEKSASRRWCRERRRVRAQLTDIYAQGMARGLGWSDGKGFEVRGAPGNADRKADYASSVWLTMLLRAGGWYGRLLLAAYG
jgi:hypothetical protein